MILSIFAVDKIWRSSCSELHMKTYEIVPGPIFHFLLWTKHIMKSLHLQFKHGHIVICLMCASILYFFIPRFQIFLVISHVFNFIYFIFYLFNGHKDKCYYLFIIISIWKDCNWHVLHCHHYVLLNLIKWWKFLMMHDRFFQWLCFSTSSAPKSKL